MLCPDAVCFQSVRERDGQKGMHVTITPDIPDRILREEKDRST